MKKAIYSLIILSGLITAALPLATQAAEPIASDTFKVAIPYGTTNSVDVAKLQQFLFDQGFFKAIPNGNYLATTKTAVQAFQKSQGISATGNFGPLTMVAVNTAIKQYALKHPVATIGIQSVAQTPPKNLVAAIFQIFTNSNSKTLKWETSSYPANLGVNINLIKKTSDSPASYDFVRQLGKDIPNTGSFEWAPKGNETGPFLYVEVTCGSNTPPNQACQVDEGPIQVN